MAATVDYRPAKLHRKGWRGDTVAEPITIQEAGVAADVSTRTYTSQLRRSANSTTAVDLEVDMTGAATGLIVLRLTAAVTAGLSGSYAWDLQQDLGGSVRTLVEGTWTFGTDVTREVVV